MHAAIAFVFALLFEVIGQVLKWMMDDMEWEL